MATKKKKKAVKKLKPVGLKKVFDGAYKLVEKGWTQKSFAKTASGLDTDYDSKSAASFCLDGAIQRAAKDLVGRNSHDLYLEAENYLLKCLPKGGDFMSIWTFNDSPRRTQEQVLNLLDNVRNSL